MHVSRIETVASSLGSSPTEDELIAFALSLSKRDRKHVTQAIKACMSVGLDYISTRMVLMALYQRRQSTIR